MPTVFRHKLSLVSFKAGLIGEYIEGGVTYEMQLRKVTLKNVKTQGNYSSVNDSGRWTSVSGSTDIVLYNNPSGEALSHLTTLSLGDDQLVIPQGHETSASGVTIAIVYYDTKEGVERTVSINLRNKKWENDFSPLDPNGASFVDRLYTKAYVHHLVVCKEMLAAQIASLHNIAFYLWLVGEARKHIIAGDFAEWKRAMVEKLARRL